MSKRIAVTSEQIKWCKRSLPKYPSDELYYGNEFACLIPAFIERVEQEVRLRVSQRKNMQTTINELLEALRDVLADHDERMRLYPEKNDQPNRLHVMGAARTAIVKATEGS